MSFKESFAKKICDARYRSGYTQQDIAEMLSVSVRWYQRLENGENLPSAPLLIKLMLIFDMTPEEFRDYLDF